MMKKRCQRVHNEDIDCGCDKKTVSDQKKHPDIETRIYNALNTAEKVAVKLAQINQILKESRKKKKKKNKKFGKVDKKTGTLILKGQKKQKKAKLFKRHKKTGRAAAK